MKLFALAVGILLSSQSFAAVKVAEIFCVIGAPGAMGDAVELADLNLFDGEQTAYAQVTTQSAGASCSAGGLFNKGNLALLKMEFTDAAGNKGVAAASNRSDRKHWEFQSAAGLRCGCTIR